MKHITSSDIDDNLFYLDGLHYVKNLYHLDYSIRETASGSETLIGIRDSERGGWFVYPVHWSQWSSNGISGVSTLDAAITLINSHLGVIGGAGGSVVVDQGDNTQLTALDGGTAVTTVFDTTVGDGDATTTSFDPVYDGGTAETIF